MSILYYEHKEVQNVIIIYIYINMIKNIFIEKYDRIKGLLLTAIAMRTDEDLVDLRNILESFPFFIQFTKYEFHNY